MIKTPGFFEGIKYASPCMLNHVKKLIVAESIDSNIYCKRENTELESSLFILIEQPEENSAHCYYFISDAYDQKSNTYGYYSMPLQAVKKLADLEDNHFYYPLGKNKPKKV